jgi:putative addiction module component (TIGR02574 family)
MYNKEQLLNLPVDEKLELVEVLWDSIDNDTMGKKFSKQEIEEELDQRIDQITKNPKSLISWEDVKAKMKM